MKSNAKRLRKSAANELRRSRRSTSGATKADHATRAASYKALADNDEWLSGAPHRSGKRETRKEHVGKLITDTIDRIVKLESDLAEAKEVLTQSLRALRTAQGATRRSRHPRSTRNPTEGTIQRWDNEGGATKGKRAKTR